MRKQKGPKKVKKLAVAKNCPFDKDGSNPNFLDTKTLEKYVSERGKILSAARTGICTLHQRRVNAAVKYARHLALLPFVQRV